MEPSSPPPAGAGLPRRRIIRSRAIFSAARTQGRRLNHPCMTLQVLPRTSGKGDVAFLTPKRIGTAVVRNQLRRQMREVYRQCLSQVGPDLHLIWVARGAAQKLAHVDLEACMCDLAARAAKKR